MLSIPRPITPPDQFMKLSKWKFHHASSVIHCWRISDSQAFELTKQSNIIHSDNFLLHHTKLAGLQSQKLGVQLHPCSNIEPPLAIARSMIGCYHHNVACLSFCLSVMPCIVAEWLYPTEKVSEQVNRKCLLGTRRYNFQPWSTPTLSPQFPQPEISTSGNWNCHADHGYSRQRSVPYIVDPTLCSRDGQPDHATLFYNILADQNFLRSTIGYRSNSWTSCFFFI